MYSTLPFLLLLSLAMSEILDTENMKKPFSGFFYSMPKTLLSGKNETVCLSTHHPPALPFNIIVDLKIKENNFLTTRNINSEHSCFELYVPHSNKKEPQFASVRVQIQLSHLVYSAHSLDPVIVYPNKKIIFIETDRATYKSEDTLKIKILTLQENLLPPQNYSLSYVQIRNPLGVGVMAWENVTTELGLTQFEYQLPRYAVLGKWKIEAEGTTKLFEVNKYVLPRFKVFVLHPKVLYYQASSVAIQVCSKYSYGGIVRGTAFIRLSDFHNNITIQALKKMTDGCAAFAVSEDILLKNIKKITAAQSKIGILITATVTEYGTDKIELTKSKIFVIFKAYNMKFLNNNIFFPGLPYYGAIIFNNVNTDLNGEVIEICYNIAVKKSWNYLNNEQCSNFSVTSNKSINFHILPLKNNIIHVQLNARSLNHTNIGDTLLVVRVYSQSSSHLMLNAIHPGEKSKCGAIQQFSVDYTADNLYENQNITFYYMLKSRNQIYKMRKVVHAVQKRFPNYTDEYRDLLGVNHRYTKLDAAIGRFLMKFKLDEKIISNYQLLVYYVTSEGEIVSASKEIEVDSCLTNKVKANWSHRQIVPGRTASLLLETKSNSLCSVSAVDKATQFMDGINTLDAKTILKPFIQEREHIESGRKTCISPTKRTRQSFSHNRLKDQDLKRTKRFIYSFSEDYDAYDIFSKFGIITITNFKVVTKPCYTGPLPAITNSVQYLTDQYDIQSDERVTSVRSLFPETWLWELVPVRNAAVIHRNLPHTVTTWVTNVLCVSAVDGVGVSEVTEISTFQPFFVDVLLPRSIKKGETLYLHTIVFNYLTYNIPIRITLQTTDGLTPINVAKKHVGSYCILSNSTVSHVFELKAVEAKSVNITVKAELDPSYPGQCGPDILINKSDAVSKTIVVEPEGYSVQITKSALLCESEQQKLKNISWTLTLPNDVIPETPRAEIVLNADILGPVIENFDSLIVMPTGCGEQILANLAPNLYVLKYLNVTRSLTATTRHKIMRNLKIGYQRILNYVHKDGSFSAFGYHDPSGSMFLTAFVVRTLQEIKRYIYVDQRIIDRAVSWILDHQLENGCFNTMLHVFQDMGGTSVENSTAALTAYVMISLLDGNIEVLETVKANAKYCIRGHYHLDKYTLAISSYALLKVNWYSEANRMLKKLFQVASEKDNMLWWTTKEMSGSSASDVEITSYVLLSLLHQKTQESLAKAHSIVQWLTTQQGIRGEFISTQDTVVALDALTKYVLFINYKSTNLNVSVRAASQRYQFETNSRDYLKSKRILLDKPDSNIEISVQGQGCILAQTSLVYFMNHVTTNEAFKLDMEILPVSNIDECSIVTLSSCFTYNGPDTQSNMAIMEVNLPSGYEADRNSLYSLIDANQTKVKMFEELEEKIVLYMTKLNSQPVCVDFNINEYAVVYSRSNSTVKVYDYYKPENSILKFYKLMGRCEFTNSSLPQISKHLTRSTTKESIKTLTKRNVENGSEILDF